MVINRQILNYFPEIFKHVFLTVLTKGSGIVLFLVLKDFLSDLQYVSLAVNYSLYQFAMMAASIGFSENLVAIFSRVKIEVGVVKSLLATNLLLGIGLSAAFYFISIRDFNFETWCFILFGLLVGIMNNIGVYLRYVRSKREFFFLYVGHFFFFGALFFRYSYSLEHNLFLPIGLIFLLILILVRFFRNFDLRDLSFSDVFNSFFKLKDYVIVSFASWFFSWGLVFILNNYYKPEDLSDYVLMTNILVVTSAVVGLASQLWNPKYIEKRKFDLGRAEKLNGLFYFGLSIMFFCVFALCFFVARNYITALSGSYFHLFHSDKGLIYYFILVMNVINIMPAIQCGFSYYSTEESTLFRNIQFFILLISILVIWAVSSFYNFEVLLFSLYFLYILRSFVTWAFSPWRSQLKTNFSFLLILNLLILIYLFYERFS